MNTASTRPQEEQAVGVVLVEDDPATQDRLISIIESCTRIKLLGVASTAHEAFTLLFMTTPAVALIDLGLPDKSGIEVIEWVSKNKPETETLVITAFGDEDHVVRSLEAGASGYLLKDSSSEQLIDHILEVVNGGSPISPLIARQLLAKIQTSRTLEDSTKAARPDPDETRKACNITDRELKVIQEVARGYTAQEIAAQMGISTHTVATHVKRIYKKLQVHSRSEAVYEANLLGLLDL